VRYTHEKSGAPILVTEHGMATPTTVSVAILASALDGLFAAWTRPFRCCAPLHCRLLDKSDWAFGDES
jgi:hypothetical protein